MANKVEVIYDDKTFETLITVNGKMIDTSRINGKEIADWAYPFMMRKVRWNGFYEEMVQALGGQKAFDLVFEGSDVALAELKEAWEAPVNVISGGNTGSVVTITYDEKSLTTEIAVNGQPFDTSRINGKEIADWVYPFMMRKVKWDGIFEELAKIVGSQEYTIQFSGSNVAMNELMEECPETLSITKCKNNSITTVTSLASRTAATKASVSDVKMQSNTAVTDKEKRKEDFYKKYGRNWRWEYYTLEDKIKNSHIKGLWYQNVELNEDKADYQFRKSEFYKTYGEEWEYDGGASTQEELAQRFYVRGLWYRDFRGWYEKGQRLFQMATVLGHPDAQSELDCNKKNCMALVKRYDLGYPFGFYDKEKAIETYKFIQSTFDLEGWEDYTCRSRIAA